MVELGAIQTTPGSRHDVWEPHMDAALGSSWRRRICSLALAAGVAVPAIVAGTEVQAHGNIISGGSLQGEVWLYTDRSIFRYNPDDPNGAVFQNTYGRPESDLRGGAENHFEERQIFLDRVKNLVFGVENGTFANPPDLNFNATIINYPNESDFLTNSFSANISDFLGADFPEGASDPSNLRQSFWRFSGAINTQADTTYDFRIYTDDGSALWLGDAAVGVGTEVSAFNMRQPFEACCTPSLQGTGEAVPFELWYWEDTVGMGLRVDVSITGPLEQGGSFVPLGAPEINGNGFAYIAFILGSLGLWLYSGGGVGGLGSRPVRGQDPGSTGLRAAAA